MHRNKILKILLILGGIVEIAIGILFLVLDPFLEQLGLENIPVITQMAGTFVLCYGILLIYSSRDVKKLVFIPLVNILARIIMIIFSLINLTEYPEFSMILVFAIPYDILWSLFFIIISKREGIILQKN